MEPPCAKHRNTTWNFRPEHTQMTSWVTLREDWDEDLALQANSRHQACGCQVVSGTMTCQYFETEEEARQWADALHTRDADHPKVLYHATTPRKAKKYRETGRIVGPVRGFDTLPAAMAWAMKTRRTVILEIIPGGELHKLPDHHNAFGTAWWTGDVPTESFRCVYSAEDKLNEEEPAYGNPVTVWICGKIKAGGWAEFVGAYSSEDLAVAACKDASYFVGPAVVNQTAPEPPMTWHGAYYPHDNPDER